VSGPPDNGGRSPAEESFYDHEEHYDDGHWPEVEPAVTSRPPRSGRRSHPILTALAILAAIVVIAAGAVYVWANSQINPGGHRGAVVTVVIPDGSSTSQIGDRLASAGVIHDGYLFALYVRVHGYGPLYPGTYKLQRNLPYSAAISALRAGPKILVDNLLIPEGFTVAQIAHAVASLPNMGLSAQKFMAAAADGSVRSPFEPAGVNNLEGLLFPATYQVRQGESEVEILQEMEDTFYQRAQSLGITAAAAKLGVTPYQVITVASIIEREAKRPVDRPNVASTIYNRLRIGMTLGADSTQTYYMRLRDPSVLPTPHQLNQPSPYNTRVNKGLPPTPIADPGLASLQAAAAPPATHYLYWVEINPDGQLGFASNNAGFVGLQQQCRAAGLC
jgi:UPF0755 protein